VETWKRRLDSEGVAIESIVIWPRGAQSIYFRDPDGHLVELITPGFWAIYWTQLGQFCIRGMTTILEGVLRLVGAGHVPPHLET
jgi:hypothetical protein